MGLDLIGFLCCHHDEFLIEVSSFFEISSTLLYERKFLIIKFMNWGILNYFLRTLNRLWEPKKLLWFKSFQVFVVFITKKGRGEPWFRTTKSKIRSQKKIQLCTLKSTGKTKPLTYISPYHIHKNSNERGY